MSAVSRFFAEKLPILVWARHYSVEAAMSDGSAAIIVTMMLVPQALAYALLSGLPAEVGLYASMLPLLAYALLGTSSTLAVGPVAVAALMTASAIAPFTQISLAAGLEAALILSIISGVFLLLCGSLNIGFLSNFLSHSVIAGFLSAACLLIATSQLSTLLGFASHGANLSELLANLLSNLPHIHWPTILASILVLTALVLNRQFGRQLLLQLGMSSLWSQILNRAMPAMLVIISTLFMKADWDWALQIKTVGAIPSGMPNFGVPTLALGDWKTLLLPAIFISIIGYIESIAVAQRLAAKRREHINPNQELLALGMANIGAGFSSGMPVAGGVSRSVVNMDAGARTPMAGLFTALGMLAAAYFIAPWLADLPKLTLAAIIIVAVMGLFDINAFKHTWALNKRDFFALLITFLTTLFINVEWGIATGVLLSIGLHLYKTSHPHIAIVGRVHGTEHFRNINRHEVETCPRLVTVRMDESLYFANARFLEERIHALVAKQGDIKNLVLMCSAVNDIDASAVEVLKSINDNLKQLGIGFHLSEVKGPVMDQLQKCRLLRWLNGEVFLTQYKAYETLSKFGFRPV